MNSKLPVILSGLILSINSFADGYYAPASTSEDQPWSVIASFGNGTFQNAYSTDGSNAIGRIALGNELMLVGSSALGLELGLQTGNHMHIPIPDEYIKYFNGFPVRTNLGPMVDFLVTAKSDPIGPSEFFAELKGGLAYRNWQFKQPQFSELSRLAGEIQAGFGYPLTALTNLNLLYQGVFGGTPTIIVNVPTETARVSNIPVLHAILLGLSVNL